MCVLVWSQSIILSLLSIKLPFNRTRISLTKLYMNLRSNDLTRYAICLFLLSIGFFHTRSYKTFVDIFHIARRFSYGLLSSLQFTLDFYGIPTLFIHFNLSLLFSHWHHFGFRNYFFKFTVGLHWDNWFKRPRKRILLIKLCYFFMLFILPGLALYH